MKERKVDMSKIMEEVAMMTIEENLIIIKSPFGCIFIDRKGNQVPEPQEHILIPCTESLWETYVKLGHNIIHTPHLYFKARTILSRISKHYLKR